MCAVSRFHGTGVRTGRLGDDVGAELHDDAAEGSAAGADVKVDLGVAAQWEKS